MKTLLVLVLFLFATPAWAVPTITSAFLLAESCSSQQFSGTVHVDGTLAGTAQDIGSCFTIPDDRLAPGDDVTVRMAFGNPTVEFLNSQPFNRPDWTDIGFDIEARFLLPFAIPDAGMTLTGFARGEVSISSNITGNHLRLVTNRGTAQTDLLPCFLETDCFVVGAVRIEVTNPLVPVPEPATWLMIASGLGLLVWRRSQTA